jgi:hypothetical protein
VALYIAAMPLSTASLLVACGRSRVPALLAFPLAYNLTLHYGFISFALSLPVLMLLLAQVVKHLHSEPGQVRRSWLWTAALAVFLFLCHLQNFLYGVGAVLAFTLLASLCRGVDVCWVRARSCRPSPRCCTGGWSFPWPTLRPIPPSSMPGT